METIKEAADSLLEHKGMSIDEYKFLEKSGIFEFEKTALKPNAFAFLGSAARKIPKDLATDAKVRNSLLLKLLDIPVSASKEISGAVARELVPRILAPPKSLFMRIAEGMKGIALPVAGTAAAGLFGKELIVDPLIRRSKIKKSFNSMIKSVPQLEEKDQKQMKEYFNVVKTFSPKAASNPLVAGALVNKMMEFGGVDHKLVQDIASIEKGLERPSIIQSSAEAAAKTMTAAPGLAA